MIDEYKSKEQLINELIELRKQCAKLKKLEVEHKRLEKKLWNCEEIYRFTYENLSTALYMVNKEGKILAMNNLAAKHLEGTPKTA